MPDNLISVDEFVTARKDFASENGVVYKAVRAPGSWNDTSKSARFVMSTEEEDRHRDIVFTNGIDIETFAKNPVALWSHASWEAPIGMWDNLSKVSGRPNRLEGDIKFAETPRALELMELTKSGFVRACSIGFMPKTIRKREQAADQRWSGYEIVESELYECSLVSVPANASALAKAAKSGNPLAAEVIEEILDTWSKDPATGLLVPRKTLEEAALKDTTYASGQWIPTTGGTVVVINGPESNKWVADKALEPPFAPVPDVEKACAAAIEKALAAEPARKGIRDIVNDLLVAAGLKAAPQPEPPPPALSTESEKAAVAERLKKIRERLPAA